MKTSCPICASKNLLSIFACQKFPVYNLIQHKTREEALNAVTGQIDFQLCKDCIFCFNSAYDPVVIDYKVNYDASRSSSPFFNDYLQSVCAKLGDIFNLKNKKVIEVGCGDGAFLNMLRERYDFKALGYDVSINQMRFKDITFINSYYRAIDNSADIILLRHILEHQPDPRSFIEEVIGTTPAVYIEVPAWEWIVKNNSIMFISYEHCSYFTAKSLSYCLKEYTHPVIEYGFNGEYLQFFGGAGGGSNGHQWLTEDVINQTLSLVIGIQDTLDKLSALIQPIVSKSILWGAGGKGTVLLNLLNISYKQMPYIVDSNKARTNTFIPIMAQEVIPPEALKDINPGYIFLTNSLYADEIRHQLDFLGIHPSIIRLDKYMHYGFSY